MNNNDTTIHRTLQTMQQNLNAKYFTEKFKLGKYNLLYLNINSLRNKFEEIELLIEQIKISEGKIIHFIALTETRIKSHDIPFYNIANYLSFHCTRDDGYGGCALFVHNSLTCNFVKNKSIHNIELITVYIIEPAINITVVYKQPTVNGEIFIHTLIPFIENTGKNIVVGDTNINLIADSAIAKKYIDSLVSLGFVIINKLDQKNATRVANRLLNGRYVTSKTVIDHVISNCLNYSYLISLNDSPISDHKEMIIAFDDMKNSNFINVERTSSFTKIDSQKFDTELNNMITDNTRATFEDINAFVEQLDAIKSDCLVTITRKYRSNPKKAWVTDDFLQLIESLASFKLQTHQHSARIIQDN